MYIGEYDLLVNCILINNLFVRSTEEFRCDLGY